MTNKQFAAWRRKHFRSVLAAANATGLSRDTIGALESGVSRKGNAYPVPVYVEIFCAGWTIGVRSYDGGAVMVG